MDYFYIWSRTESPSSRQWEDGSRNLPAAPLPMRPPSLPISLQSARAAERESRARPFLYLLCWHQIWFIKTLNLCLLNLFHLFLTICFEGLFSNEPGAGCVPPSILQFSPSVWAREAVIYKLSPISLASGWFLPVGDISRKFKYSRGVWVMYVLSQAVA